MAVLTWWLNHAAKLPPQEVDVIFRGLVMPGLATELELRPRSVERRAWAGAMGQVKGGG